MLLRWCILQDDDWLRLLPLLVLVLVVLLCLLLVVLLLMLRMVVVLLGVTCRSGMAGRHLPWLLPHALPGQGGSCGRGSLLVYRHLAARCCPVCVCSL